MKSLIKERLHTVGILLFIIIISVKHSGNAVTVHQTHLSMVSSLTFIHLNYRTHPIKCTGHIEN